MGSMTFSQRVAGHCADGSIRDRLWSADDSLTDWASDEFQQLALSGLVFREEVAGWVQRDLEARYVSIWRSARRDGGGRVAWCGARRVLLGIGIGLKVCGYPDLADTAMDLSRLADHLAFPN
jgi:hypothetical protein